jgi:hypothetical protein
MTEKVELNLFEAPNREGGQEVEPAEAEAPTVPSPAEQRDAAVKKERERTDETTATPTELGGGGATDSPGTHDGGDAST